jgi:hypothetical protein
MKNLDMKTDLEIISTEQMFSDFINSSIHTDFLNEIDVRIEYYKNCLVDEDVKYSGREYDVFRGFINNLKHCRNIFHMLKENKINDSLKGVPNVK